MSAERTPPPEQPHVVALVLQSKKALQHGQALCARAHAISTESARHAVDVLALDAKVKWTSNAVREQLKLAASVARRIEARRADVERQAKEWDIQKAQRSDALDAILESLGEQVVPPDFYETSSGTSPFGSQDSSEEEAQGQRRPVTQGSHDGLAPNGTHARKKRPREDWSRWKTLRDFVDERAIDEVLETMDNDRLALEDVLATTADYSTVLNGHITTIREGMPGANTAPTIESVLLAQEKVSTDMAGHLESLAAHYDQMAAALHDHEAGEAFSDEDLQEMNRDTEELPAIITELEDNVSSIERLNEQLQRAKAAAQEHVSLHRSTLDDLEELGEVMTDMLQHQDQVQADCVERMSHLQGHLMTLEELHHKYTSYQLSYNKLLIEIARRRQYREAAENIVRGMMAQLDAMTEEERIVRQDFNEEHGQYLPSDLCLCIENPPTKWAIVPWNGEPEEVLPDVDNDLLLEAKDRTVNSGGLAGSQSL
ncbi:hypothetical protein GLOTRDRAFT_77963 [Gloeophyllum trabeum ATCC 11539]|uniref:Autophagy-related protein 17 n=1 Tax=Gloeophyllum trabeum (strain ATCC 11539 / FP-39264 / Madison 617) TaxID=670483 RepID=S7Q3D2_GLOTA|nr:uncharacterized protein GLOTRDRAFT_77963 [Gloeophyllum trabeum ATCC 11539]EPQ54057.1 hypothetical protein GLOTRDRAFT_77963 [Gloeophyllum trabeum ATCC 11539]